MKKQRLYFKSIFSRFSFAIIVIMLVSFTALVIIAGMIINYHYTELRKDELSYIARSAREAVEDRYRQFVRINPEGLFWEENADRATRSQRNHFSFCRYFQDSLPFH